MNKKGFTLIELLATIVLLAIIVAIAVPAVNGMIDKGKKENCSSLKKGIIKAAELYVSDNKYTLYWNSDNTTIVDRDTGYSTYLNGNEIINPCDNTNYSGNIRVVLKKDNGDIKFLKFMIGNREKEWKEIFSCCE